MIRMFTAMAMSVAAVASSAAPPANPNIDYRGFRDLTESIEQYRNDRLVSWDEFLEASRQPGALILDARSADAYAAGHIGRAVNLPLTDFTAKSLARVIGPRDRPILIYCNNNFRNDVAPVALKRRELALNIHTFINLVGYGYPNVHELNEVVDFNDPKVKWVKGRSLARVRAIRPSPAPASRE